MNEKHWKRQERAHTILGITSLMISSILAIRCLSMNKWVFIAFLISCTCTAFIACQEGKQCLD